MESPSAVENCPVTLECEVVGSPEISIEWHKGDSRVRQTTRVRTEFDGKNCRLIFLRTELDDEADYKCVARNDFGMASTECELLVEEDLSPSHSLPFFKKKPHNQTVSEGQYVAFSAVVGGSPPPEVDWFKDGRVVEDKGRFLIKEDVNQGKFSLTIEQTFLEDVGTYKCVAFNEIGEESYQASLAVIPLAKKGEPTVEVPFEVSVNAESATPLSFSVEPESVSTLGERETTKGKPEQPKMKLAASRETTLKDLEPPFFIALPEGSSPFEVNVDEDVTLRVRVSGKPLPEVKWLKDDKPLSKTDHFLWNSDKDIHTLVIRGPTPKDKGTYVCVASNDAGTATRSFDVNIEGYEDWVMPSFEEYLASPFQISDNGDVTMEVKVSGNPSPNVEWRKNDQPITENEHIKLFSSGNIHKLVVKGASPEDEGKYICTATNPAGKSTRTYTLDIGGLKPRPVETGRVDVEETIKPPRIVEQTDQQSSFNVSKDGDVKLEVQFSGSPDIVWMKDEKPIQESNHFQIQSRSGVQTLVIKGATPEDKGLYKCTASNKAGMSWKTFTVDFKGAENAHRGDLPSELERPSFVEDESVVPFQLTDHGDVKLAARVQGNPIPHVEWDKDDIPLQDSEHIGIASTDDLHTLLIQNPTVDDKGTYTLTATNEAGVGTRAFNVEIEGSSLCRNLAVKKVKGFFFYSSLNSLVWSFLIFFLADYTFVTLLYKFNLSTGRSYCSRHDGVHIIIQLSHVVRQ